MGRTPTGHPTIRDVARLAGVAVGTASRALNRSGSVSSDTLAAVQRAARKLDYQADALAQSLRTRTTRVVGLLVSDFSNPLWARVIAATESRLQTDGYALLLANTHHRAASERSLIELFRRRRVDGLVLGPCESERPSMLDALAQRQMPVVALDRDFGGHCSGVQVDHFGGALQATRHLLQLGHRDIALLTPGSHLRPGRERINGFRAAHAERGLQPEPALIRAERSAMEFAFSEALSLLSRPVPPTAFVCLGTRILAGVLKAMRHSGRSMPDDVSVLSIGDSDLAQVFTPALTTLHWDLEAVGTAAAELLLRRLMAADTTHQPEEDHSERIVIATELLLRESVAPPPGLSAAVVPRRSAATTRDERQR